MFSSPRIIVGTDFSPSSDFALKAAEKLRRKSNGTIQLVYIASFPDEWDWLTNDVVANYLPSNFKRDLVTGITKEMSEQIRRCEASATPEIIFGKSYKSFLSLIDERKPDLAVVGRHGKSGFEKLMGSFTTRVVSASQIPVLVVNKEFDPTDIFGLVDPTEPMKSVYSASEECGLLFGGEVTFLSVSPDPRFHLPVYSVSRAYTDEESDSILASMNKKMSANADPHIQARILPMIAIGKSVTDAILEKLHSENANLAIVGRHQRNAIENFFLGSVARRILEKASCNILVLPPVNK